MIQSWPSNHMRINEDHLYHGAALTQIAEYPTFKAINAFSANGEKSRSAFTVNHDTGVYLKYASKPNSSGEYVFTFSADNLGELAALKEQYHKRVFVVFICRKAREICVMTVDQFEAKIKQREGAKGESESNYQLLVTLPQGKSFRAYVNYPGKKRTFIKPHTIISRNEFPKAIFNGA